jgi:hypothetical protein
MEDRRPEAPFERLLDPLGLEPVRAESLELDRQLVAFCVVGGEPEAAGASEGVARQPFEAIERLLGLPPEPDGAIAADGLDGDVERSGTAAEREAAVPSTGAAGDLARVVEAYPQAGLREAEGGRAPRDAAADDDCIRGAVETPWANRRRGLVQPVAGQLRREVARRIGTKARLPTSLVPLTVL